VSPLEWTVVLFAVTFSAVIKNSVGVGAGIFMLPLMAMVLPAKLALGLGAPAMLVSDMVGCVSYYREWSRRDLAALLPAALFGIAAGVLLVDIVPPAAFRMLVGVFALAFALSNLRKLYTRAESGIPEWITGTRAGLAIGFVGGAASSIAHAGGIVWSLFLMQKRLPKREFVATIVVMFLITNIIKTASFLYIRIISVEHVLDVLLCAPLIIFGGFCGNLLNKRMEMRTFRLLVLLVIAVMGIKMIVR
jgi:uncharacterized membrane protein YfcA